MIPVETEAAEDQNRTLPIFFSLTPTPAPHHPTNTFFFTFAEDAAVMELFTGATCQQRKRAEAAPEMPGLSSPHPLSNTQQAGGLLPGPHGDHAGVLLHSVETSHRKAPHQKSPATIPDCPPPASGASGREIQHLTMEIQKRSKQDSLVKSALGVAHIWVRILHPAVLLWFHISSRLMSKTAQISTTHDRLSR